MCFDIFNKAQWEEYRDNSRHLPFHLEFSHPVDKEAMNSRLVKIETREKIIWCCANYLQSSLRIITT